MSEVHFEPSVSLEAILDYVTDPVNRAHLIEEAYLSLSHITMGVPVDERLREG